MNRTAHALIWAAAIIGSAAVAAANEVSDAASFALVIGMSGAAWTAISAKTPRRRRCSL